MRRIVAIVEGQTEEHFIRRTYPSALILRPFTNGKDVSTEVISKKIAAPLARIGADFADFIILVDREKRKASATEFANELHGELAKLAPGRRFSIGVPDIHIENWILADEAEMRRRFDGAFTYAGDGVAAKGVLRTISGISHSPLERAELLKACAANQIEGRSPSFAAFKAQVRCEWPWLNAGAA